MNVFVVEDDLGIVESLREGLACQGFAVIYISSGCIVVEQVVDADLVLFDLGFFDFDGKEVCWQIWVILIVLIIVLIAWGDEIDWVVFFEFGVDDYLVKLFGFRELVARIGAVICCTGQVMGPLTIVQRIGVMTIDRDVYWVFVDGRDVDMILKEYAFLAMLVEWFGAV